MRVAAAGGGEAEVLTTPNRERGEVRHAWPSFLPGGRSLLFTIINAVRGPEGARIAVLNLETGATTVLLSGHRARYVPSGHIVFGTENTLRAVAFDLERLTVAGEPVPVVSPVVTNQGPNQQGPPEYDVAADGTLVYLPTSIASPATRTPVWVDRQRRETSLGMQGRPYVHPRLTPDGTRVAIWDRGDIWIWDLVRSRLTRGTLDGATISIWTPDSARLIFSAIRGGGPANLYTQAADGTGTATRLTDSPNLNNPTGFTPDGTQVVFNEANPAQQGDIGLLTLTPTPQVKPLVATRYDERGGVVSPDGRWLAYESDRSGAYEVWVQPFPIVDGGLWQASNAGGVQPLWARNGRELFYVAPDGALMAVQWEGRGSLWSAGTTTRLIEGRYFGGGVGTTVRQYDVTADGQRFLMMKDEVRQTDAAPSISVVQDWMEELKRLVPTK
jgi:serine/threonine-protein kinase